MNIALLADIKSPAAAFLLAALDSGAINTTRPDLLRALGAGLVAAIYVDACNKLELR